MTQTIARVLSAHLAKRGIFEEHGISLYLYSYIAAVFV